MAAILTISVAGKNENEFRSSIEPGSPLCVMCTYETTLQEKKIKTFNKRITMTMQKKKGKIFCALELEIKMIFCCCCCAHFTHSVCSLFYAIFLGAKTKSYILRMVLFTLVHIDVIFLRFVFLFFSFFFLCNAGRTKEWKNKIIVEAKLLL